MKSEETVGVSTAAPRTATGIKIWVQIYLPGLILVVPAWHGPIAGRPCQLAVKEINDTVLDGLVPLASYTRACDVSRVEMHWSLIHILGKEILFLLITPLATMSMSENMHIFEILYPTHHLSAAHVLLSTYVFMHAPLRLWQTNARCTQGGVPLIAIMSANLIHAQINYACHLKLHSVYAY
jgi:hypothetical protein